MGRPREHDNATRAALRAAAERIVATDGHDALSVRTVANAAGTTTRAVYSVFGSKDGLVDALAQTAFEFLYTEIRALRETNDPVADLVDIGVKVFRRLVLERPVLYRIAFQRVALGLRAGAELAAARQRAFRQLQRRIRRVQASGQLGRTSICDATIAFEATMEGLANAELRGTTLPILPTGDRARAWSRALRAVIRGLA
jgi:AcrR family transcriptional regulator